MNLTLLLFSFLMSTAPHAVHAQDQSAVVCVPPWLKLVFEEHGCSRQNKAIIRASKCEAPLEAVRIKSECLSIHENFKHSVCIDSGALTSFRKWKSNTNLIPCDKSSGVLDWQEKSSGCAENLKRIYVSPESDRHCKQLLDFKPDSVCDSTEGSQQLIDFCPVQTASSESCPGKVQIWKSFSEFNTETCSSAIDAFHQIHCLNQESQAFWNQDCKNDSRRVPVYDQNFCQGGAALVKKQDPNSSAFCNQLATGVLESQCISETIHTRLNSSCEHSIGHTASCPSGEYLVLDQPDSSCIRKIQLERKVDRSLISSCLPLDKLEKEKTLLRDVFETFVQTQDDYSSGNIDHLSETIAIVNAGTGLTESEKARLRSIFIQQHFVLSSKQKKWNHLESLRHLLDHEKDWHTRAQIVFEYTKAVGVFKHQLDRLQNELILTKLSNPDSAIAKYFSGADVNACNYIIQIIVDAYPLTFQCSKKHTRGTLMAQCEIEKKSVSRINKSEFLKLTKKDEFFYSELEALLQKKGPLVYCGLDHCAMFVIEEEKVFIYDGTVTPNGVERDKFIRRTVLKDNPGVLRFHYRQLTLKNSKLYSFKAI